MSDMATTTSQLQAKLLALTGGQVDIMLNENTFKNSTQILREMADAWEDMTDVQRAAALELMGGKRQANVLSALIQNFDTVEKVIETSANSAGSALKENERYLDSIQGKIDQFTNATQVMWSNFIDADWVKRIVEIGTVLIKIIDGFEILGVKIGGVIPTLITLAAVIAKIKYKLTWSELFTSVGTAVTKLNKNLTNLASRFGILGTTTTATRTSMRGVTVEMLKQQMAAAGVDAENQKLILSKIGLANAGAMQLVGSKALVLSTLREAVANEALSATQAVSIAQKLGLITVTKGLNVANASHIMQLMGLDRQQRLNIISTLGLTMETQKLTKEEIMNALAKAGVTNAAKQEQLANLMLLASQGKLRASLKLLSLQIKDFIAKNTLLIAITAAIAAIALVIKGVDALIKTSEELKEKLSESQNALEDTTSALKDLRNELDEVNAAIQELQTQGTLSLTDQAELNRLRAQRRELESTIALKSQLETSQQKTVNKDAQAAYDAYKTANFKNGQDIGQYAETGGKVGAGIGGAVGAIALGGIATAGVAAAGAKIGGVIGTALGGPVGTIIGIGLGALVGAVAGGLVGAAGGAVASEAGKDVEEQLDAIKAERDNLEKKRDEAYRAYVADPENERLLKKYEKAEEKLTEYDTKMAEHVAEIQQLRNQMDWSTATPSQRETIEEMDDFIDRYNIIMKSQGAVGNAIERILGYDRYDGISERIEELVEKYKETEDGTILTQIAEEAKVAEADLADVSLSIQDVVDYYTLEKGLFDTSTIEGVTNQYLKGIKLMQELADNTKPIEIKIDNKIQTFSFDDLFEQDESGKFKAREKEFSEMLKGMDEKAQNTFKKFAEHVKNSELTWSQAMEAMKHSANLVGYEFIGQQIAEANTEIFKGIQDDISGTIDTFKEFSSALEDVASSLNLLNTAQTQFNTAGRISVKTALEIIESTDNWNDVLDITNGTITLQSNATQVLIQDKLDLIKANIENEIQQLEEQKSTILAQDASNDFATTIEESTNLAIRNMAGSMAYLTTMMEAYTRAANGEKINTEDYLAKAEKAKLEAIDGAQGELDWKKNSAEEIGLETINKRLEDAYARQSLIGQIDTVDEFKNYYDFDKTPGDQYGEDTETAVKNGWEALVNKYENELALITNERDLIEAEIDKAEANGGKASAQYYKDLIRSSEEEKILLEQKKTALEQYLEANKDNIDPDTWTEYNNEINETAVAIKECEVNTIEWYEAIREIDLHYFEQITNAVSRLGDELDFVNSLLEDEEVADANGNWSSAALTRIGLYTQQMEKAAVEAARYQDEIDRLNAARKGVITDPRIAELRSQYKPGDIIPKEVMAEIERLAEESQLFVDSIQSMSEEEYQAKLAELTSTQQDVIQSYEDAKDGIVELNEARIDAIKNGIEEEIEAYEDYIDTVKEALDAERDLYDFKNKIKNQTKDIASLERRIAALSGSTNAADIAERRKLEAQLFEAKEGLNDAYYEHSRDAQSNALDDEAEAFSESKEKYIEELEATLDDVETLITNSLMDVMLNADTVLVQLNKLADSYGINLSAELTQPWKDASAQAIAWKTELQNSMTSGEYAALIGEGGAITAFANGVATKLKGSWSEAQTAAKGYVDFLTNDELGNKFSKTITGFGTQIQSLVTYWNNVKKAAEAAHAEQEREVTVGGNSNLGGKLENDNDNTPPEKETVVDSKGKAIDTDIERLQAILNKFFNAGLTVDGSYGPKTTAAVKAMQKTIGDVQDGLYTAETKSKLQAYLNKQNVSSWFKETGVYIPGALKTRKSSSGGGSGGLGGQVHVKYAKGTMGTTKDQWAITDEPWLGDELTMYATPDGKLSYMRSGSTVIPADITENLVEWGKLNPNMMNLPNTSANINMISNAVNKPEFNLSFEALVKADKIDQDTLPEVKKFVQREINSLVKQMNYALKGVGSR